MDALGKLVTGDQTTEGASEGNSGKVEGRVSSNDSNVTEGGSSNATQVDAQDKDSNAANSILKAPEQLLDKSV